MQSLSREIRFTVNPFAQRQIEGSNSYCSRPSGNGLGVFLSLWVELYGDVDSDTGFVINLVDIDRIVRSVAVPLFTQSICESYAVGQDLSCNELYHLLKRSAQTLSYSFGTQRLESLVLALNPYRTIKYLKEYENLMYYSEKFEFAAMHRLWNPGFSDEKNRLVFGKCANPNGHGHNYIAEITVSLPSDASFEFGTFQSVVDENFIGLVDHKNLNADVEYFEDTNPTLENITRYGWKSLENRFANAKLDTITVWENNRAFCTYRGE